MKCSQTHFEIKSSKIYETFHDGSLKFSTRTEKQYFSLISALNIMQATIETDPNDIVIIALVNSPSNTQTLVRINTFY